MSDFKLHDFVGKLTKQKKVKTKQLADICGLSRTTLYRHTKGILPIPPKIEAAMAKALHMNSEERDEFRQLISITVQDGSMISARYVLDSLVFAGNSIYSELNAEKETMFALHQKDSYLRKLGEVTDMILEHSGEPDFSCDIKVVGCISKDLRNALQSLLTPMLKASKNVRVEHLLVFPKNDYLRVSETLRSIMPLLGYVNYHMMYDSDTQHQSGTVLNDFLLVNVERDGFRQFYVMSLASEGLSQAAVFENEDMYRFFVENYSLFKNRCKDVWIRAKNVPVLNEHLLKHEITKPQCMIKADIGYNKIPLAVYESIYKRCPETLESMPFLDERTTVENLFATLQVRNNMAYKEGNVDVYSSSGLQAFTKEGRLFDHFSWMPTFTICERKMILSSIRECMVKKPKGYSMYITDKEITHTFCAFQDSGSLIKFEQRLDLCENIYVENKMIADIIFDYAKNHVSAYHAMSEKAALRFVDELIKGLG